MLRNRVRPYDLLKNVKVKVSQAAQANVRYRRRQSETRVRPLAAFRVYVEDQSSAVNAGLVQFLN